MKCTEVGELMQRHLDYDLNESELEVLMTHLSECNQCTELFEKLTLLSGSLEQLPRVTPSISIVDAILPELDKIEQAKEKEKKLSLLKRKRIRTTVGSIATAAAIMLLMVNLSGNSYNSSNELALTNTNKSKQSAANSGAPSVADENHSSLVINDTEESESDNKDSMIQLYKAVPTTSTREMESEGKNDDSSQPDTGSIASTPNIFHPDKVDPITEGPIPSEDEAGTYQAIRDGEGLFTQPPDKFMNITGAEEQQEQSNNLASTTPLNESIQYFSNDGLFYLQFETHTIAVYETSTSEIMQEWNKPLEGAYQFLSWEKDDAGFTFQVTDVAGKVNSFSWKIR